MAKQSKQTEAKTKSFGNFIENQSESTQKSLKVKRNRWIHSQKRAYFRFACQYRKRLEMNKKVDKQRIFNKMAYQINKHSESEISRNSRQCKSHHQKMIHKYKSIKIMLQVEKQHLQGLDNFLYSDNIEEHLPLEGLQTFSTQCSLSQKTSKHNYSEREMEQIDEDYFDSQSPSYLFDYEPFQDQHFL